MTAPEGPLQAILEEAILVDASDSDDLRELRVALAAVIPELPDAASAQAALETLDRLIADGGEDAQAVLDKAMAALTEPSTEGQGFRLPEHIDQQIFDEFIAAQGSNLDELEALVMNLGQGDDGTSALARKLHTLKGESGMLGLVAVESFCHQVEERLKGLRCTQEETDELLGAVDWIRQALTAYCAGELPCAPSTLAEPKPQPSATAIAAPAPAEVPAPEPAPAGVAAPETSVPKPVDRDEDEIMLFGEFLAESDDGLNTADELLMGIDEAEDPAETVNALFRVFHSIKGVAGFLELEQIQALAHRTETLLSDFRERPGPLPPGAVDLVFDATSLMRQMLAYVREALEAGTSVRSAPGVQSLLSRLQAGIDDPEELTHQVPPEPAPVEARIGDILRQTTGVTPEAVEAAAQSQTSSGRKLGQELVSAGEVQPKQVAAAVQSQRASQRNRIRETVKIDLARVDRLVETIGELVIVESMVMNSPALAGMDADSLLTSLSMLSKITRDLQDLGMGMRMVPVRGLFQKMARMVRDLSRKGGKQIQFVQSGEGTEMDRSMVEQLADPLVHMIRNAVDHGIATPDLRRRAGKPAMGTIHLSAYHEGGNIVVEIQDDGQGLNREAILAKARRQGMIAEDVEPPDAEVFQLIFAPGFSTAAQVTTISGRGVGMDVVRKNIEALRGRIAIESRAGEGTSFKLILPLTLAIIDGMLVACGDEQFIIPTLSIIESFKPRPGMVRGDPRGRELVQQREEIFPVRRLDDLLGIPGAHRDPTDALIVILESQGKRLALMVDEVLTQQQVVIKNVGTPIDGTEYIAGAAILSTGRVGLILNVDELSRLEAPTPHQWAPLPTPTTQVSACK